MPTFSPFNNFGLFSKPATNQNVNWLGESTVLGQVTSSNSSDPKTSVPFWWLFYRLKLEGSYYVSIPNGDENPPTVISGDFVSEFFCNIPPKERICTPLNLIEGNVDSGNVTISGLDEGAYNMRPFKCDNLHSLFYASTDTLGGLSAQAFFYATTSPTPINYPFVGQLVRAYSSSQTITFPDDNELSLNLFVDFFDAGYLGYTQNFSCEITDYEFYTLQI